jgi:hypothetical protein
MLQQADLGIVREFAPLLMQSSHWDRRQVQGAGLLPCKLPAVPLRQGNTLSSGQKLYLCFSFIRQVLNGIQGYRTNMVDTHLLFDRNAPWIIMNSSSYLTAANPLSSRKLGGESYDNTGRVASCVDPLFCPELSSLQ